MVPDIMFHYTSNFIECVFISLPYSMAILFTVNCTINVEAYIRARTHAPMIEHMSYSTMSTFEIISR